MSRVIFIFLLLFLMVSCGNSSRKCPIEYNDAIITEQHKIISMALEMSNAAWTDVDYALKLREDLENQVNESRNIIGKLPPFDTDSRFRDTSLRLFSFYAEVSQNQYVEMLHIIKNKGKELSLSEMERLDQLIIEVTQKEQILDGMFIKAQQDFARKHGLKINESELQQKIDLL